MARPIVSKSKHLAYVSKAKSFCLDMAPAPGTRLSVVMGGVELCGAGYVNTRDGFPFLSVELVSGGEGELVLSGKELKLSCGTVFSYGPGVPHEIRQAGHAKMMKFFVAFTGSAADEFLQTCGLRPGSAMRVTNLERVVAAFENLVANGCDDDAHCREICALSLESLLLVLADHVVAYDAAANKALETFQFARDKIDGGFLQLHDLHQIASLCGLDPSYLCRLFKRFAQKTPYKYLLEVKMRHAAGIIRSERILVKELARRLGYSDPYQFSRIFKSVHGLSPENYALLVSRML
jgi:AraC-like DNA-binding protein